MTLNEILKFAEMLNTFRNVERVLYANGTDRMENDVEHSYQLAMLAWFIASSNNLDMDMDRIIKYALVHDLVEVYAGDTYVYSEDQAIHDSKEAREHDAFLRLQEKFPEAMEILSSISSYEKRGDRESRFVYALDKIQPVISIYLDKGRMWREMNITWQMLFESKKDKVALSPEIEPYFTELMTLLKENEERLFKK